MARALGRKFGRNVLFYGKAVARAATRRAETKTERRGRSKPLRLTREPTAFLTPLMATKKSELGH